MDTGTTRHAAKREIELDFIRGIAILVVLDFHSPVTLLFYPLRRLGFPHFGWVGVDIFFVLSGFLVGGLLIKEWKVRGRIDSRQFLVRRGFKIWPQYYVFLLVILLTGHRGVRPLWGNMLNIQNYTRGIGHTWTLAVEEHAYLLLAFGLALAARHGLRMRRLAALLAGVSALVIAVRLVQARAGYETFFWTHTRIDGIFYGVILAIAYHHQPELFRRLQAMWWIWVAVVLAALAYLCSNPAPWWGPPVGWIWADAMGVALLMLLYRHRPESAGRRNPLYRLVAWIGLYSYGIYLWHVSVVAPMQRIALHLPAPWARSWMAVMCPVAGIAVGVFFTRMVEIPALRLRERLAPRRVDSAVGIPAEQEAVILEAPSR